MGNLAKNWYRESQIFEVRQAHPRTILVKEPPLGIHIPIQGSIPGEVLQIIPGSYVLHQFLKAESTTGFELATGPVVWDQ